MNTEPQTAVHRLHVDDLGTLALGLVRELATWRGMRIERTRLLWRVLGGLGCNEREVQAISMRLVVASETLAAGDAHLASLLALNAFEASHGVPSRSTVPSGTKRSASRARKRTKR